MAGIVTGAKAYVTWGLESGYAQGATVDRQFGIKQAVSNFTLTNNRIDLNRLGQIETADYAYGTQSGSLGISFVLADSVSSSISPASATESADDIFSLIFGADTAGVYGGLTQGDALVSSKSATINVGVDTVGAGLNTGKKVRTCKGSILNSLSISSAVGDTVNCTADFTFAKESLPTLVYADAQPTYTTVNPYTFAHATFKGALGSASSVGTTSLELIQDAEINFGLNSEILYQLGDFQGVDSFKRNLDITGRFRLPWSDWVLYERVLAQIGEGESAGTEKPNINDTDATQTSGTADLEYMFTNGNRSMKIELGGVSITDIGITGLEPVEPIYQELTFKAKTCKITVDTTG